MVSPPILQACMKSQMLSQLGLPKQMTVVPMHTCAWTHGHTHNTVPCMPWPQHLMKMDCLSLRLMSP
jgi:hypothetical protein